MAIKSANSSKFGIVLVSGLHVDPEAQRKLSPAWVKAHVPLFDVDQLGFIVVNTRTSGKQYIVDGQHRVELMRAVGWGDQKIHAELFEGLTQAGEAELFNSRNDRKAVRNIDKFRIKITAGDEAACDIQKIVTAHGLLISDQVADGHIVAVAAIERVYEGAGIASPKEGPAALGKALKTLVQSFGKQQASVNGAVVQGLGMVYLRYNGKINEKELVDKLAPMPGGCPGLVGKGRSMRELRGRPLPHCIASIVVDIYNRGRRTEKIEAWES